MKVAIASLRFAPGHIAHLRAYLELFTSLGCEASLFLDESYKEFMGEKKNVVYFQSDVEIIEWCPSIVISYNIANENISLARKCKKKNIFFYYILHEPWDSFRDLISLGKRMPRRVAANVVNYLTAHNAYKVILASENGQRKYERYMKRCNKNYAVFPLIFCDDYDGKKVIERKYLSFIGGFTEPRACSSFIDFIKYSVAKESHIKFCIASRDKVDAYLDNPIMKKALQDGILTVYSGRPMTTEEINCHYRESICSWNAYKISTQSGVLPNALMQGSPVLVTDRGDSVNVVAEKKEGCYISRQYDNKEIEGAFEYIEKHIKEMSEAARKKFLSTYEYSVYIEKAKSIYEVE